MGKFASRKFLVTLISAAFVALNQALGLDLSEETILAVAGIVVAYLAGQSYVDRKEKA